MKSLDLEKIKNKIEKSLVCPLKDNAINMVFGKGSPDAPIMFIGEAPGDKEDKLGVPFVGQAGKRLDKYLQAIGLTLDDVYIANILKYRPPKNRDPKPDEILAHTPYLIEQIKVIKPKIIATLGNFSTKFVLSKFKVKGMKKIPGVSELHGQITPIKIGRNEFIVVPLYHPAATMYRPKLRLVLEEDFWKMGKFLSKEIGHKLPRRVKQEKLV
jgi:DNA polymerase